MFFLLFALVCMLAPSQAIATARIGAAESQDASKAQDAPKLTALQKQLKKEADELANWAIRRRYGAGFAPLPSKAAPRIIEINTLDTLAAAMALRETASILNTAEHQKIAFEVCNMLRAAQQRTGRIPGRLKLTPGAVAFADPPAQRNARQPTTAAVAFLLAMGRTRELDDPINITATNGVNWLLSQQGRNGLWIERRMLPTDDKKPKQHIGVWLDRTDYRDAVLAITLAAYRLEHHGAKAALKRSAGKLLDMRVQIIGRPPELWTSHYNGGGKPVAPIMQQRIDMLATRHAMQMLLGIYVLGGQQPGITGLIAANKSLAVLKSKQDAWHRHYTIRGQAIKQGPRQAPEERGLFPEPIALSEVTFGLDVMMRSCTELSVLRRNRYATILRANRPADVQVALVLIGLTDSMLALDWPVAADEVEAAIKARADRWKLLKGEPPLDLAGRTRRVFALVERVRLEQLEIRRDAKKE